MIKSFASNLIYSFILIFSLSSCSALISKMYGVNQIHGVNEEEIHQFYTEIDFSGIPIKSSSIHYNLKRLVNMKMRLSKRI